jgi:CheY-like chemotaxis protein
MNPTPSSERSVRSIRVDEGLIHEVSVRFDGKIDPSAYCSAATQTRVLLAEDSAAISRLTKMLLESFNTEVEIAESGRIAVEKAMKSAYDVILMDMEMPDTDGFEATRLLRQRGYSGRIYAVTGRAAKDDVDRCLAVGCNKHFAKPISKETLSEIVSSIREEPLASTLRRGAREGTSSESR